MQRKKISELLMERPGIKNPKNLGIFVFEGDLML